jgi:hypothetical protein
LPLRGSPSRRAAFRAACDEPKRNPKFAFSQKIDFRGGAEKFSPFSEGGCAMLGQETTQQAFAPRS